ncbi:methylmalonyl Co-A mutase-associated GTPase MeaB [Bacillus luteolus]|uniref:Methylmalonyl Co-A mutase-associated GTPase MeaB n=1 Tax=Litchfieldia luteola TaxID=682179 RepID=A0ABR9QPJ5_9BACI|nr:methylmalonyl Co-A mutase-associated GTPase MeaB [Cytobacillus luteolus]MBE4910423.1 methylmalonyl Co-A mutase-associated GTPase MeaB [Cytobacillus luteolus]MBP1942001.1 LAO/AO transport system kinase [Cytobacillus luteolus]
MKNDRNRPEWVPKDKQDDISFTTNVMKGIEGDSNDGVPSHSRKFVKKHDRTVDEYVSGVLKNDRTILAQAITLVESNATKHLEKAQDVINELLPHVGKSIRIGITGVPGAGKSTFIEAFGKYLCEKGHRVAVLAVDPSSSVTGGSILGDKTRMEELSRDRRAFVRPSPSGGTLGGVNRKTRETILLCEAAGYDVILVETIGVGQSEVVVRSMVDFFLLLVLTGAGDELQGMKKGVMELADALLINKADGDNKQKAIATQAEYNRILHYLRPATVGWLTKAYTASALYGEGMDSLWKTILQFEAETKNSGTFEKRRQNQSREWIDAMIKDHLISSFFSDPTIKAKLPILEQDVLSGKQTVTKGVREILNFYERKTK